MKVGFDSHFSRDVLERYSLAMLSEQGCADVEEHLLMCPYCQTQLEEADTYIRLVKSAYALILSRSHGIPRPRAMQVAESL